MACDNILYYEADECSTNYAGVSAESYIVPFSPSTEAGQNNIRLIREWNLNNRSQKGSSSQSFKSLRLPADLGEDDEKPVAKLIGCVAVENNPLKSSFGSPSQGPKRGKMFNNELKLALIGRSLDDIDFLMSLSMESHIGVVFKDANGNYRLMADPDFPVDAQVDDQSGEGPSSEASATATFSQTAQHPPFFYRGQLSYGVSFDPKDSIHTIDCLTGLEVEPEAPKEDLGDDNNS